MSPDDAAAQLTAALEQTELGRFKLVHGSGGRLIVLGDAPSAKRALLDRLAVADLMPEGWTFDGDHSNVSHKRGTRVTWSLGLIPLEAARHKKALREGLRDKQRSIFNPSDANSATALGYE